MINHHRNIHRMYNDMLLGEKSTLGVGDSVGVKDDLVSRGHCYSSLICLYFLVIFIFVPLMVSLLCL